MAGCSPGVNSDLASITGDSERLAPEFILQRAQSQLDEPVRGVIRTESEWKEFLQEAFGRGESAESAGVDFGDSFVAVASMGERATGGFNVSIPDAYVRRDSMFVLVRHTIPGKNCIVPQARTAPVTAVSVPRVAGNLRFVVEERTLSCN